MSASHNLCMQASSVLHGMAQRQTARDVSGKQAEKDARKQVRSIRQMQTLQPECSWYHWSFRHIHLVCIQWSLHFADSSHQPVKQPVLSGSICRHPDPRDHRRHAHHQRATSTSRYDIRMPLRDDFSTRSVFQPRATAITHGHLCVYETRDGNMLPMMKVIPKICTAEPIPQTVRGDKWVCKLIGDEAGAVMGSYHQVRVLFMQVC